MKYNIYDKKYVTKRINEIISLEYFKKFKNKEIYTALNSLDMDEFKLLLLPKYSEEEERQFISILRKMKRIIFENRRNQKELNSSVLLRTKFSDKCIISAREVKNITDVVNYNKELLYEDSSKQFDLRFLNEYLKHAEETKKSFSKKTGIDINSLSMMLNGKCATYYQLKKLLLYFDCYSYQELKEELEKQKDPISILSKEYFGRDVSKNLSINLCVMWEAIRYSEFDNNTKIIANYLFSGNKIDYDEASLIFKRTKEELMNIKQRCIENYSKYIKDSRKYVYENVDNK